MNSTAITLHWFYSDKISLMVPFFQRPYVWDQEDWEELINSINSSPDATMPFLGSLILQKNNHDSKLVIIDGQQRITTLSVLIKALIDNVVNKELAQLLFQFQSLIYEISIVDLNPKFRNRLTPSSIDGSQFELVMKTDFDSTKPFPETGKIVEAYLFFSKLFKANTPQQNREFASKILTNDKFLITVLLEETEDEQMIFDSVNSLGRDLTNTDIIKNYLFQKLRSLSGTDAQSVSLINDIHKKYWEKKFYSEERRNFWEREKILGRIKSNYLESFLKDFASIKKIYTPSETGGIIGLSKAYKNYINTINNFEKLKEFIIEISDYSDSFYKYTSEYESTSSFIIEDILNTTLLILDKTETTTFNPYIMKLVKENPVDKNNKLFELQRFLVQRLIYKAKTKNYNKVCMNILEEDRDVGKYLRFYNDNEPMGLNEYPSGLNRINNKPATLILFLVELIHRKGEEDRYSDSLFYNKSLEHIMPKEWQKHWSNVQCYSEEIKIEKIPRVYNGLVTDRAEVIETRKNAIQSIGNMTLLNGALNSSISNNDFETKVDGDSKKAGIRKYGSSLSITQDIIQYYDDNKTWDERAISFRNLKIFNDLNKYYNFKIFTN